MLTSGCILATTSFLHVNRVATGVELIWTVVRADKRVPCPEQPVVVVPHVFVDAKLNWSTGTAEVTVGGVEFEGRDNPCRFIPHRNPANLA